MTPHLSHATLVKIARDCNGYYNFSTKAGMAGLRTDYVDHEAWKKRSHRLLEISTNAADFSMDDLAPPSPILLGSPKPRFYDLQIFSGHSIFVSERLATVIREYGIPHSRLWPVEHQHHPAVKFKVDMQFYLWQPPIVNCLHYEYGDEMPTDERWRKRRKEAHEKMPGFFPYKEFDKPLLKIWADLEKVKQHWAFVPRKYMPSLFVTPYFIESCKLAGIYGMEHSYSLNENLEGMRSAYNGNRGMEGLKYELRRI